MASESDPTYHCVLGSGRPQHVDPSTHYTVYPEQLLRLLTRRLFGHPHVAAKNGASAFTPAPDLAVKEPTVANGGLSPDGLTCRLTIRRGVYWDAQQAREVTAHDLVRGFKRIAHPMHPETRRYFTDTIAGMREYCEAYQAAFEDGPPTGPDLAQFHMHHQLTGVRATDPWTLELRLCRPAADLSQLLATAAAAAAPREFDYYLPQSHELLRNAPSAGPYRVAAAYRIARGLERGRELILEPNPRWAPGADPLRPPPAGLIRVAGDMDGLAIPPAAPPSWRLTVTPQQATSGWTVGPYLAVNLREPSRRPVADVTVRRALTYAVDRIALRKVMAAVPDSAVVVQRGLLPPGTPGAGVADAYPGAGDGGDPVQARRMLAAAGHPHGVRLTLAAPDTALDRRLAQALETGLARAGVYLDRQHTAPGGFAAALRHPSPSWDLALTSQLPDWFGQNGRSIIGPLLRGGDEPGAANYGGYHQPEVDRLAAQALGELDRGRAIALWQQVDAVVVRDLPIIPMLAHTCGQCVSAAGATPYLSWMST